MTDMGTIDQRIRDRAANEWGNEVDAAIARVRDLCRGREIPTKIKGGRFQPPGWTDVKTGDPVKPERVYSVLQLLEVITEVIFENRREEKESAAVEAFLEQFDQLREQLASMGVG